MKKYSLLFACLFLAYNLSLAQNPYRMADAMITKYLKQDDYAARKAASPDGVVKIEGIKNTKDLIAELGTSAVEHLFIKEYNIMRTNPKAYAQKLRQLELREFSINGKTESLLSYGDWLFAESGIVRPADWQQKIIFKEDVTKLAEILEEFDAPLLPWIESAKPIETIEEGFGGGWDLYGQHPFSHFLNTFIYGLGPEFMIGIYLDVVCEIHVDYSGKQGSDSGSVLFRYDENLNKTNPCGPLFVPINSYYKGSMNKGDAFTADGGLFSNNGNYVLRVNDKGKMVLNRILHEGDCHGNTHYEIRKKWVAGSDRKPNPNNSATINYVSFSAEGDFCYKSVKGDNWCVSQEPGRQNITQRAERLVLTDAGELQVVDAAGKVLWSVDAGQ